MQSIEVVVARYNEDVKWCLTFPYPCIVYNKTPNEIKGLNLTQFDIPIDDFGREASTWLMHIINRYDQLTDYTIFVQGKWDDHAGEITDKLHFDKPFSWLTLQMMEQPAKEGFQDKLYGEVYSELFPLKYPEGSFNFGRGGMFMVNKELIQSHPVDYYQCILNFCRNSYPDKIWACYLERFWDKIFYNH
jgi:hypothetical protein